MNPVADVVAIENGFLVIYADAVPHELTARGLGTVDLGTLAGVGVKALCDHIGVKPVRDEVLAEHDAAMREAPPAERTPVHATVQRMKFCADTAAINEALGAAIVAQRRRQSLARDGKLMPLGHVVLR